MSRLTNAIGYGKDGVWAIRLPLSALNNVADAIETGRRGRMGDTGIHI